MYDLLIFLKCSGINVRFDNLSDTLKSIRNNIGINNYGFCLYVDDNIFDNVKNICIELGIKNKIVHLEKNNNSWAFDFNNFFTSFKTKTKWIMCSHDDVNYRTPNFFEKTLSLVSGKEKEIGWITYTSDIYYRIYNRCIPNACRCGFENDIHKWPYVYECHKFDKLLHPNGRVKNNLHLLDYPKPNSLTKVHGIMSSVMIISAESLKKVGLCEDWTRYTIMIDEDWSLSSLKQNLWNIWISDIFIDHPLRNNQRPMAGNKWEKEAHAGFTKKWSFSQPYNDKTIEYILKKYKGTNMTWSIGRNTYDWEYLE